MTQTLLELVPVYGLWLIALSVFAACLALPVPASFVMIAGGAFSAAGELSLGLTLLVCYLAAVSADQIGFAIGQRGSGLLMRLENGSPKRRALVQRARAFTERWGNIGVFLSRWLLSPLGPYVNYIVGAAGFKWANFTLFAALGEIIWVGFYVGIGYIFSDQIEQVARTAGNISGLLTVTVIVLLFLRVLFRPRKRNTADQ